MTTPDQAATIKPRRPPRPPMTPEVRISKALSYTLRHGATKEGLTLREDGYALVSDLLNMNKFKSLQLTVPLLESIVSSNDKQRFTLLPSSSGLMIRASQGHSIPISSEALQLESLPDPGICVHGTFYAFYEKILESGGLKRMGRMHVHFSTLEGWEKGGTVSGMRKDAEVVVVVDAGKAVREGGLRFWRSSNGVVLTEGDERGVVGLEWVVRIEDRKTELGVLWENGKVVKELPEKLRNRQAPRGKGFV
ncbi:hypothetical protein K440DRAFT_578693, partial [Wilcoxina mikolae CBS 423.85]